MTLSYYSKYTLYKMPKFHLIKWSGNFAKVSVEFWENHWKLCWDCIVFPQNFHIRKLGEISVFYAVIKLLQIFCWLVVIKVPSSKYPGSLSFRGRGGSSISNSAVSSSNLCQNLQNYSLLAFLRSIASTVFANSMPKENIMR